MQHDWIIEKFLCKLNWILWLAYAGGRKTHRPALKLSTHSGYKLPPKPAPAATAYGTNPTAKRPNSSSRLCTIASIHTRHDSTNNSSFNCTTSSPSRSPTNNTWLPVLLWSRSWSWLRCRGRLGCWCRFGLDLHGLHLMLQ